MADDKPKIEEARSGESLESAKESSDSIAGVSKSLDGTKESSDSIPGDSQADSSRDDSPLKAEEEKPQEASDAKAQEAGEEKPQEERVEKLQEGRDEKPFKVESAPTHAYAPGESPIKADEEKKAGGGKKADEEATLDVSKFPAFSGFVEPEPEIEPEPTVAISARDVSFFYGDFQALRRISLEIMTDEVTAFIGPSGCGKSTFLKLLNRMNDFVLGARLAGEILVGGTSLYGPEADPVDIRRRVGMVFQRPNPFPKSIYDNICYGPRLVGVKKRADLDVVVEKALKAAALWDEVKDLLGKSAFELSGGQQQRVCIARALALEPEILLMDEPTSALDPIATAKVEEWIKQAGMTIVIVTHNMQQAARVSDRTAFFYMGELVEFGPTLELFTSPKETRTENYITGRFG